MLVGVQSSEPEIVFRFPSVPRRYWSGEVRLVRQGEDAETLSPCADARVVEGAVRVRDLAPDAFCYVRVTTAQENLAWSSPVWGDEVARS